MPPARRRVLVCGAGGFVASHLVRRLKAEGAWVRGVDLKAPSFSASAADDFVLCDLREPAAAAQALALDDPPFDEVYQLAADMGGMGFIHHAETDVLRNNVLINVHLAHAAAEAGVARYFFSSSVCVYRDMATGEPEFDEDGAYPALPDNEYGWEKLYSERVALAFGRRHGMAVRVGRFENCYGPEGAWRGGREKAPAALCRKVAEAPDGGTVEVWGKGNAVRSYVYIDDLVDAVVLLMRSDATTPVNIGTSESVTVDQLVALIASVAAKTLTVRHIDGPVGVRSRNFSHTRMEALGWVARVGLREGLERTYAWVADQVRRAEGR